MYVVKPMKQVMKHETNDDLQYETNIMLNGTNPYIKP